MKKILIVDDHAVVREGLKRIIEEDARMKVAAEASNGAEAINIVQQKSFDAVVLDITMPGISGLDVLKQVKALKPELPVLVLSMHPEEQYAVRILKAGASGYLTKESASDQLVNALLKVTGGGRYVSASLAEKLAFRLSDEEERPPHELLSDREFQVLSLIASGKQVGEIGDELALSPKTVSTYRTRILEKMGMKTNAELTHYAVKNGIV